VPGEGLGSTKLKESGRRITEGEQICPSEEGTQLWNFRIRGERTFGKTSKRTQPGRREEDSLADGSGDNAHEITMGKKTKLRTGQSNVESHRISDA